MKLLKITFTVLFSFLLLSAFSLKKKEEKQVYVFGISTSFKDTLVYYTDIQILDSVKLDKRGFLPHKEIYSNQLKDYLEYQKGMTTPMCMVYFSKNKSKLEKEAGKLLNRHKKSGNVITQKISTSEFRFKKPED